MARNALQALIPLAVVLGIGYVAYDKGEREHISGQTNGLANFAGAVDSFFGGVTSNINKGGTPQASAPPASAAPASGGSAGSFPSGVYTGNAANITAAAQAAGVTDATDPRAYQYGAALWSLQAKQPMSAFSNLPGTAQVTFNSVAINGH